MTTSARYYITTAIPYVNGAPHLGHALEFVQADVLARHRRLRGDAVRFLSGTDDNAVKNVAAARSAGIPVDEFVRGNSRRFSDLGGLLRLSFDDFIRTSSDPRHRPAVERLWRECNGNGDFYRKSYTGRYCPGCEQFYLPDELVDGKCTEHRTFAEVVTEENWFFRLSRYSEHIQRAIESGLVRIEPSTKRNEVLSFIRAGLIDISVSRPAERAAGWGIPVPGDPGQIVYVWWDALANYVSALGYGTGDQDYREWWGTGGQRVHVIGKGIVRFHAVYWLALLLSAGLPLPTSILVHDYINLGGRKLAKSSGSDANPAELADRYGADPVRWWLLREVPRVGDVEFTAERLAARANTELANGIGNLVNRSITLVHRYRSGRVQLDAAELGAALGAATRNLPGRVDECLSNFEFRGATDAVWVVADEANKLINLEEPWRLARQEAAGDAAAADRLTRLLHQLVASCRILARELGPFIPDGSIELRRQLTEGAVVGDPVPAFPRLRVSR